MGPAKTIYTPEPAVPVAPGLNVFVLFVNIAEAVVVVPSEVLAP